MIAMMAKPIGMPSIPLDTPANKRVAMEEMCAILCRHDRDAQAVIAKYDGIKRKYESSKAKLRRLKAQCRRLNLEIERNRQMLADHMDKIHTREQTMIDEKLARLEEMVSFQIEEQQKLVAERQTPRARTGRSGFAEREPLKPKPAPRTDEDTRTRDGGRKSPRK
jgi:hypothetical protein